ncbi:MAG: indole-3-glycerol phosphate synthase TrpC [Desulfuromonas thiophila]|jgi:indole-3-glycerol phosphate synthase|nr:indole-3-glycerol phosphate synthase TrpC [Desulfuromonas thiophila]MDY0397334.1 indole-3-glycerol phosphate synthase TrpC [Desulfuromonas thiophila]
MILDRILEHKRQEVAADRQRQSLVELQRKCHDLPPTRGFIVRLRQSAACDTAIIAEVKKGSPSKGIIRADFDPLAIARAYAANGAACLSVLTDNAFFYGQLDYLPAIAEAVAIPLLRKDFIVDPYQIYQARLWRADAVLLIAAALSLPQLQEFADLAASLGLDVLLEVHNESELAAALQTSCPLVGINNRCLNRFVTDLAVTERLLPQIPADRFVVAESGIRDRGDIERLQRAGAGAFLVGETLMREADVGAALRRLRGQDLA